MAATPRPLSVPFEALSRVFAFLPDGNTVFAFSRTCKSFYAVAADTSNRKRLLIRHHGANAAHKLILEHGRLLLRRSPGCSEDLVQWLCVGTGTDSSRLQCVPPSRYTLQAAFRTITETTCKLPYSRNRSFVTRWMQSGSGAWELCNVVRRISEALYPGEDGLLGDDLTAFCEALDMPAPYSNQNSNGITDFTNHFTSRIILEDHQLEQLRRLVLEYNFAPTFAGHTKLEYDTLIWDLATFTPELVPALIPRWRPTLNVETVMVEGFAHASDISGFQLVADDLMPQLGVDRDMALRVFPQLMQKISNRLLRDEEDGTGTLHPGLLKFLEVARAWGLSFMDLAERHYDTSRANIGCMVELSLVSERLDEMAERKLRADPSKDTPKPDPTEGLAYTVLGRIMRRMEEGVAKGDEEMVRRVRMFPFGFITRHFPSHPILQPTLHFLISVSISLTRARLKGSSVPGRVFESSGNAFAAALRTLMDLGADVADEDVLALRVAGKLLEGSEVRADGDVNARLARAAEDGERSGNRSPTPPPLPTGVGMACKRDSSAWVWFRGVHQAMEGSLAKRERERRRALGMEVEVEWESEETDDTATWEDGFLALLEAETECVGLGEPEEPEIYSFFD